MTFQLAPALSGYDALRTGHFYNELLERLRCNAWREVGGARHCPDSRGRRMGQHHVSRRLQVQGRRGHAGLHERALFRVLPDDGYSVAGRARFHRPGREGGATVAIVNRRFAEHFFPGRSPWAGVSAGATVVRRPSSTSKSSASSPIRYTKDRGRACDGRCSFPELGTERCDVLCSYGIGSAGTYSMIRARSRTSMQRCRSTS